MHLTRKWWERRVADQSSPFPHIDELDAVSSRPRLSWSVLQSQGCHILQLSSADPQRKPDFSTRNALACLQCGTILDKKTSNKQGDATGVTGRYPLEWARMPPA